MKHWPLILIPSVCLLASCIALRPADFAGDSPVFDPLDFFSGRSESSGVMENRSGAPVKRVKTRTVGFWQDGVLRLEQELNIDGEPSSHRVWRLRRIDEHHFEGTANDMVGTARGEARGPVFHWTFTLALSPGNPLANVRMSQWMYLQPDRRTMVNHTTVTKAGIVLSQVTEQFRITSSRP